MYDSIIIGGGPAGLTAAIYLGRAGRKTLLIERIPGGGQTGAINEVFNYPGYEKISGYELLEIMQKQALSFGVEIVMEEVSEIDAVSMIVKTRSGNEYSGKTLIVATGCKSKKLGVAGEDMLQGRGVSYCATCDGNFYKGRVVAVVGNGEKAVSDAEYLAPIASKTYLINLNSAVAQGVETLVGSVTKLIGSPLKQIEITSEDGKAFAVDCDCLFVSTGYVPLTGLLAGQVERDVNGYVITDENCETTIKGVFAVGDIRVKGLRQIVTAAADGAIAAQKAIVRAKEKN